MRLYLKLSRNSQTIPFDYQVNLVGALHKWLGQNNYHDELSLYSLSWLMGDSKKQGNGLAFPSGAHLFISSPDEVFIKKILRGVMDDPSVCFGMVVKDALIQETPDFNEQQRFSVASPVFLKRTIERKQIFYFYDQIESDALLTETLQSKLKKMGLPDEGVSVRFDRDYSNPKIKVSTYKGIKNKANICPVIVEGTPEQIGFAWNVGVGNSTGIGFGALTL
jgi:CRISPR-associated endoribonuclease Cas6